MNKNLIKIILSAAKNLFVVSLIVYLVLFLLEVVFPGFVSNSFNLNWILGAVLVLGILAALAPEESPFVETTGDLRKSDYWLFAGMGVIGGLLMFYRSDLAMWARIILGLATTVLISGFSWLLMVMDDKEAIEEISSEEGKSLSKFELAKLMVAMKKGLVKFRRAFLKPISLPAGAWVILVILLGLSFFRPAEKAVETTDDTQIMTDEASEASEASEPKEPTVAPFLAQEFSYLPSVPPTDQQLTETLITVLNGSTQVGSASAMANYLRERDFLINNIADADKYDYQNAIVRFKPEQQVVANYLIQVVNNIYPKVEAAPAATDSADTEIVLILGNIE